MIALPSDKDNAKATDFDWISWWEGMCKGNHVAFEKIYREAFSPLYRYGSHISPEDQVEEVLQELFIHLWEKRDTLPSVDSPMAYLYRVFRNRLLDAIQCRKKNPMLASDTLPDFQYLTQEDPYVSSRRDTLQKAIDQLSPQQKEVIYLLYFNNLSATEVAEALSLKIRTVYNTAHQAVTALRKHLQKDSFLFYLIPAGFLFLFLL